jgi:CheY-like chemotaxis protein
MQETRKTILCVEDEDLQLKLREVLFQSAGFDVLLARTGSEAIDFLRQRPVDAVVMDYSLAGMDGVAVARELKQLRPRTPILMFTGVSSFPAGAAEVDAWFRKADVEPERLIDEVKALTDAVPGGSLNTNES